MAFKPLEQILEVDPRFHGLGSLSANGFRPIELEEHYASVAKLRLRGSAPDPVRNAFDRARSIIFYAWFDYDLLVVAEGQALGAFELALKARLDDGFTEARGGLGGLIDRARAHGIFPPARSEPYQMDPVDALRHLRNGLAHGSADVHSPSMALEVLGTCSNAIDVIFR